MRTTLVIMAAGIGSRFGGGIKQLAPVGLNGEIIMDYSIHDAIEAGFNKIVFIIRKDIKDAFKEAIGNRIEKICNNLDVEIAYAYQELNELPEGVELPAGRTKPWGTGQAVLACKEVLHEPFAVINADDYYGKKAFVTVLRDWSDLQNACNFAFSYSRSHRIIIEEFIEKKHKYLIGGDIFVYDGKAILWGLLNCHRDINVNPLVPVGKSYPLLLDEQDKAEVQKTLQSMINKLGIRFGSVNVELVVDKFGKVWPIDVGPRAGGNMIPDLLGLIFGVDVVEMAVLTSMGETITLNL